MSLRSSTDYENDGFPCPGSSNPVCHSRAGGNPGLFCAELTWIPAFAGMTEPETLVVAQIINTQVFSQDVTKDTKGLDDQIPELRALRVLLRKYL